MLKTTNSVINTSQITGTLPVANGGTGLTTLTASYIPYGNGTSAFSSSSTLLTNGSQLALGSSSLSGILNSSAGNGGAYININNSTSGNLFQLENNSAYHDIYCTGAIPLSFYTNGTEKMRIASSGGVSIGNTTDPGASNLSVTGGSNGGGALLVSASSQNNSAIVTVGNGLSGTNQSMSLVQTDNTSYHDKILFVNTNGIVGKISTTGSATAFTTSSDYRLKENVTPMVGALDIVAQLKPVTYDWIFNKSKGQGFIAHELQTVIPDCVTGIKDEVDAEGKPVYQGVDTSFLVATLTAAIQELNNKFNVYIASHP